MRILTDEVIESEVARLAKEAGVPADSYRFDAGYDIQTDSCALRLLFKNRTTYAAIGFHHTDRLLDLDQFSEKLCAPLVEKLQAHFAENQQVAA